MKVRTQIKKLNTCYVLLPEKLQNEKCGHEKYEKGIICTNVRVR